MKKRTVLFIDGTNLYAGQYQLFGPKKYLDFKVLIKLLEKNLKISFAHIYFYASYSPKTSRSTKKEKAYLRNEALFYRNVKSIKNLTFFKGYRSKTSGKEKEVDVKMAVDIVDFAYQDKYRQLFFFSGDADFMHAIRVAVRLKKKIAVVALEDRIPYSLSYLYPTYVVCASRKTNRVRFDKNQKIKKFLSCEEFSKKC